MRSEPIGTIQTSSNISSTLVGNKIVDYSDVVGASPVGGSNYISIRYLKQGFNGFDKGKATGGRDEKKFKGFFFLGGVVVVRRLQEVWL